ncbi:MAG TPA: chloride channel protein [Gemmatimonadaceae bacterium]|jgi:H+/Cl- antiporter ClcA/CBS domain-containing protein|nr:chloride channel protein [Gemmatimonadaceae bacterium]
MTNPSDKDLSMESGTVPIAPGLETAEEKATGSRFAFRAPPEYSAVDRRTIGICAGAIVIAIGAALAAQLLIRLIGLVTNVTFYGRLATQFIVPWYGTHNPLLIVAIPVGGAIIVGLMARYGSAAIRGHGIPEVMEKVLYGESRIPARVLFLKPISAAIAIGTGGPFGAEGPIIATGGALGSLAGQVLHVTADERKTLLAAGAAAGMAATFGSPVSAVLLAVELLLFEYRPRSLIPVALAAAVATGVRVAFSGTAPIFAIAPLQQPTGLALLMYAVLGLVLGVCAVGVTKFSYGIEEAFEHFGERLHIHWMWWPALGAIVVGLIGIVSPRTLGVGYENITDMLSGAIVGRALLVLVALKLISWAVYLGSGTSGGTLAPLFTIGAGIGAWIGEQCAVLAPWLGIDAHVAGIVGMAAIFAGASHALLTSVVFAFETTRQPFGLLPLLTGCTASYLVALLLNRHSIMTEKLARRGASLRTEYTADFLSQVLVRDVATREVVTLRGSDTIAQAREAIASDASSATHQGFPVLDEDGRVLGVLTRRELSDASTNVAQTVAATIVRPPVVVFEDNSLRDAADQMVAEGVGRLPVVERDEPHRLVGIISRSDLLSAHEPRLNAASRVQRGRPLGSWAPRR